MDFARNIWLLICPTFAGHCAMGNQSVAGLSWQDFLKLRNQRNGVIMPRHTGFNVFVEPRILPSDETFMENLIRTIISKPL